MNIIKALFFKCETKNVFTPTSSANLSYISRDSLESTISSCLETKGKQIILFGNSGSGKTTIIRHLLKKKQIKHIITNCETKTTLEDLLLAAFDKIDKYYVSSKSSKTGRSISNELKGELNKIGASIKASVTEENSATVSRVLPPQLTPQKLAEYLGEMDAVWVIEDFHKVNESEKIRIADILKIFIDVANDYNNVRVVCIGAVGSAKELMDLDSNLFPRVAQINIPLLTDDEIAKIIERGETLLRVKMSQNLKDKIIHYSSNVASISHQMCFDICQSSNITKTQLRKKELGDERFKLAVEAYIRNNSDTFKSVYDSIVKKPISWYILRTLSDSDESGLNFESLYRKLTYSNPKQKFHKDEILAQLAALATSESNLVKFDNNSEKYYISTPFWKAFVRMQQAVEAAQSKRMKNQKKKNLTLQSQDDLDSVVYDSMLKLLEHLKTLRIDQ